MNIYKDYIKSVKSHELLLSILFIIYIALDIETPISLLSLVNNGIFQAIMFLLVISLFFYVNPIISILAILALLTLIQRSKNAVKYFMPSELEKSKNLITLNQKEINEEILQHNIQEPDVSLEENMVKVMAPPVVDSNEEFSFAAVTDKIHNAENLTN
tara:strand:+ start:2778 stop:3251 length:474 start_codon:yes stop_codon:yes gene_type:complete